MWGALQSVSSCSFEDILQRGIFYIFAMDFNALHLLMEKMAESELTLVSVLKSSKISSLMWSLMKRFGIGSSSKTLRISMRASIKPFHSPNRIVKQNAQNINDEGLDKIFSQPESEDSFVSEYEERRLTSTPTSRFSLGEYSFALLDGEAPDWLNALDVGSSRQKYTPRSPLE